MATSTQPDPAMLNQWYADYMKSQPSAAATAATPQAGTSEWKPDTNSTVAGQFGMLTAKGNPLMTQATTQAKQQANAQGMLNSTMAIQAGQIAGYNAALPIAQQDAATFADAGRFNAGAQNTAMLANANIAADMNRFNAGATNDAATQQRASGISGYQQQQQIAASDRQQAAQIAESQRQQAAQIAESQRQQAAQIDANTAAQIRDIEAQAAAQGRQLTAQETAQIRELEAAAARQQAGFTQEQTMQQAQQAFQAGENALQRAFQTGERIADQDFRGAQMALDREQQLRVQQLQEQGMDKRQAEQIAAQERQQKASQVFTADQAKQDREFQQQQQATQFAQTLERDQVLFDNNLKTMVAQTEQELRLIDAQNGTNLSSQYRSATQASYDGFIAEVTAIQQSDMDPDVKAAQVASLQSLFQSRQDYINTIFGNMPGWSSEWSQFALEFEGNP